MNEKRAILLAALTGAVILLSGFLLSASPFPGTQALKKQLLKKLTAMPSPLPSSGECPKETTMIYILGGSEESLRSKFRTAAVLYHEGKAEKIILFSYPGLTGNDPRLRRNLSHDEWVIHQLINQGISERDIELVTLPSRFFGTLNEAREISMIAAARNYHCILLVTSSHHGRRTLLTFSGFAQQRRVIIYLYTATDELRLLGLVCEYLKLLLYRTVLVPIYT